MDSLTFSLQGLPIHFCKDHLPSRDEYITLVDENGDATETKYLALKNGLSAGWRGFAIDHKLVDGDVVVFQLVSPREFKVIPKLLNSFLYLFYTLCLMFLNVELKV